MSSRESLTKPIPPTTLWYRKNGRRTKEQAAQDQRYLTGDEERVLFSEIAQTLATGLSVRGDQVRNLAFQIKRRRLDNIYQRVDIRKIRPPGKNWGGIFLERHHRGLQIERAVGLGWQRETIRYDDSMADFMATLSDVGELCSECAKIKLKLKTFLARPPSDARRLHAFQGLPKEVDESSCKLCRFVLICSKTWNWPVAVKYYLKIHHMERIFGPTLTESKLLFSLSTEDDTKEENLGWILPTLETDTGDIENLAWTFPRGTVNFDLIRSWLQFCDDNHFDTCGMSSHDEIPFFRLVDCATRSLVDAPYQPQYAALSYCWGPGEQPAQDKPNELPKNAPLVIEDALETARRLGIPYLWVDRYCIAQKDRLIKPIQLQNMHKVYRSAYVTLVAGCGACPRFGFPGVSTRERKQRVSVDTHGYRLICIPNTVEEIQGCTWSTRGWTLQENLLSKRRLVFTETQTYFQCWNMHCNEVIPSCIKRAHRKDLTRFKNYYHAFRAFPQNGIGRTGIEIEARIQEYLGRKLTVDSDAFDAFLGIFQAFQELDHPVYNFWGLPMTRFGWAKNTSPATD